VVDAFLAASRDGDFDALLALLDPDVVLWADRAAGHAGASKEVRGAPAVAATFSGRAPFAQPALVNAAPGAVRDPGGRPRVVFSFTITRGKIVEIRQIVLTSAVEGPTRSPAPVGQRMTRWFSHRGAYRRQQRDGAARRLRWESSLMT